MTPPSDRVVDIDAKHLGDANQGTVRDLDRQGRAARRPGAVVESLVVRKRRRVRPHQALIVAREDNAKAVHPKAKTGAPAAARRVRMAVRPIGGAMRAASCTPGKTYSRRPGLEIRAALHGAS